MNYGSVCSGIEAATVAWRPLGWQCSFVSEIEPFPCEVLATRLPGVPNAGDFTTIQEVDHAAIDLLVGGTPCQSFSVAGLRRGLADDRGNLALEFCRLLLRLRPRWFVWENVPGVLSSGGGEDFRAILGAFGECGYGYAYRILDAQYVRVAGLERAVPQRRRRVFVVGYFGDWRPPAAVLFEPSCLCGDSPPRREAGQGAAGDVGPCLASRGSAGGGLGTDADLDGGLIAHALRAGGAEIGENVGTALTCNHEAPIAFSCKDHGADAAATALPLRAMGHDGSHANAGGQVAVVASRDGQKRKRASEACGRDAVAFHARQDPDSGPVTHPLDTNGSSVGISTGTVVRRLTPLECERLQGFPDYWTAINLRRRRIEGAEADYLRHHGLPVEAGADGRLYTRIAADGPRYKALGNSMAVNCMRWIGRRIDFVDSVTR